MQDATKDKAQRRAAFVEKGFELFATRGIEAVSLQDIADATGLWF